MKMAALSARRPRRWKPLLGPWMHEGERSLNLRRYFEDVMLGGNIWNDFKENCG